MTQEQAGTVTGEAVALDVRSTGFLLRALGGAIDVAVSFVVLLAVGLILARVGSSLDSAALRAVAIATIVVALVVLPTVIETATRGRSLGRLAVGARIVREDGGAVRLRHAFVRALMGTVEIYLTLGGLAVLVSLLNGRSRRVGDLLAGTVSQLERVPRARSTAAEMPAELLSWAAVADVATLPDPLGRRVARFLAQQGALSPRARLGLAADLAAEAAPYASPLPAVDPAVFLAGVAALRRHREERALVAEAVRLEALTPVLRSRPHGFPER